MTLWPITYARQQLGLLFGGKLMLAMGTVALSPLLPSIIRDLSISSTAAGIALTVMSGGSALAQYPGGRLSDQLSRKTLLVSGILIAAFGISLFFIEPFVFISLVIAAGLLGFGSGLFSTTGYALLSDLYVEDRGQSFGIYTAAQDLGGAIAGGLAVGVVALATWRIAFLPILLPLLLIGGLIHTLNREPYRIRPLVLNVRDTAERLLFEPNIRWILIAYALQVFAFTASISFIPTFFSIEKRLSSVFVGSAFSMVFVIGIVARPTSGRIGDQLGRRITSISSLFFAVLGLGVFTLATGSSLILVGLIVFAVGMMSFAPPMLAYLMDIFPSDSMGGDLGAFRTAYLLFASLSPTYIGILADLWSYEFAFFTLIGFLLASLLIVVLKV